MKTRKYRPMLLSDKQAGILNFSDYKKKRFRVVYGVMIFLLVVFLVLAIFPLFYLFVQAFKTPEEINSNIFKFWPENFNIMKIFEAWQKTGLSKYFLNSLFVVVGAVVCSIVFNGLLAYGIGVLKPRGSKFFYNLILGSYMIPSVLAIIPLFAMIARLNLINTFVPLWFAFGANAFYFINFKKLF